LRKSLRTTASDGRPDDAGDTVNVDGANADSTLETSSTAPEAAGSSVEHFYPGDPRPVFSDTFVM
jgi:hypothetical protein